MATPLGLIALNRIDRHLKFGSLVRFSNIYNFLVMTQSPRAVETSF
jgi:hypothetical protein